MMKIRIILGLGLSMISGMVFATPISGVSVTTTFASPGISGSLIENIVDGSGLSSYTTGATHAAATPTNAWAALDTVTGSISFDLGGIFDLDGMAVWNFNGDATVGINSLTIEGSLDDISYALIAGAPTQFSIGADFASELAEVFSFAATAQFLRFNVTSSHDYAGIGISEVMFTGESSGSVPAPATLALIGLGLAGLRWSRRGKA